MTNTAWPKGGYAMGLSMVVMVAVGGLTGCGGRDRDEVRYEREERVRYDRDDDDDDVRVYRDDRDNRRQAFREEDIEIEDERGPYTRKVKIEEEDGKREVDIEYERNDPDVVFVEPQDSRVVVVNQALPPPVVIARPVCPGPNFIWIDGYYRPVGGRFLWVNGSWVQRRPGFAYFGPSYARVAGGGIRYYSGGWRRTTVIRGGGGPRTIIRQPSGRRTTVIRR